MSTKLKAYLTYLTLAFVLSVLSFGYGIVSFNYLLFPTNIILKTLKPETYNKIAAELSSKDINKISAEYKLAGKDLIKALKEGGYILYIRHAMKTDTGIRKALDLVYGVTKTKFKPVGMPEGLCLNEEGEVASWLLGKVINHLEIPIGEVIASPICRCVQTAEIAFGRVDNTNVNLVYDKLWVNLDSILVNEGKKNLFLSTISSGKNKVIVAHKELVIKSLNVDIEIEESATAIFKIVDGKAHLVSIMTLFDWSKLMKAESQN